MPHCIAPGCTSGYKSNPEKVYFFTVPKDENHITLWQKAIRRKDFVVRLGQAVCANHFLSEDILWKRELTGSDGRVLGVSYYKRPRLRKGVVPSQFPWMENSQNNAILHEENQVHDIVQQCGEEVVQEITSSEPTKDLFGDLIACTTLQVPDNWIRRTVNCDGRAMESFVAAQCMKIEDNFITVNMQELMVQDNLHLKINIMGKPFNATSFEICSDVLNSIEEVETTLNILDAKKIGPGAPVAKNAMCTSNIANTDNIGTVRHKQCLILLESEGQWIFWKRLESTFKKKQLRMKQQRKRIRLTLSPRKQKNLHKLREKCHYVFKAKGRTDKKCHLFKNMKPIYMFCNICILIVILIIGKKTQR